MNLVQFNKGNDTDGEFRFSELIFEFDGEAIHAICIEANELRLLLCSDKSIDALVNEMELFEGPEFETEIIDAQGNITTSHQTIDVEALLAYFMESKVERYECWRNDLGNEGLCDAVESETAVPLILAYEYLRSSSADNVYKLLEAAEADNCFEFDGSFW